MPNLKRAADHPRYGCGDEEVEILPDEHEQRDADDDTDQKPRLPNSIPESSSGAGTSRSERVASRMPPPSIGRRRRRPHSHQDPIAAPVERPALWPRSGCRREATSAPHTATNKRKTSTKTIPKSVGAFSVRQLI